MAGHSLDFGHPILFEKTHSHIISKSCRYFQRVIREGMEIFKHSHQVVNSDTVHSLPVSWRRLFCRETGGPITTRRQIIAGNDRAGPTSTSLAAMISDLL